jgi:L-ascorbate metabolism protein UlaG (beta-lactamase superfamily)
MFGLRCREALVLRDGETAVAAGMGISAFAVEHSGYENAYLVEYGELSFFYAGDAKYSPAFATVGRAHQPLISFLPVGGTEILGRRVVMGPEDALQAALDLGTRVVTPIHSGGEWLSLPPLSRHPGRAARLAALAERSKAPFRAVVLAPGERASIAADGSVIRRTRERGDGR